MKIVLCFSLIFAFNWSALVAQLAFHDSPFVIGETTRDQSLFDSWEEEELLSLQLEANFSELIAEKNQGDYRSARLVLHPKEDREVSTLVKIKARGKYRRRICDFPPLKLKISGKELSGIELKNYKTFKLVTHCDNKTPTRSTILREYLAYRLYAVLSEASYRVQLVEITYVDEGKVLPKLKRYGFLLEDTDELEDRLGARDCDCGFNATDPSSQDAAATLALFQFMIGNNDWDFSAPRNLKVLQTEAGDGQVVIPYDFDFSAFVGAPYAFPNVDYALTDLRDRVLLIDSLDPTALARAAAHFRAKRPQVLALIKGQAGLNRTTRKELAHYVESFYTLLDRDLEWTHKLVVPFGAN